MYCRADRWEAAHKVAVGYMTDAEAALLYTKRARELEANQRWKEAEKMYLTVKEHDLAINMYKKNRMYDHMIRLVSTFRKDLLAETHLHLAQQLEGDHSWRDAEKQYLEAKDWKSAVQMYRANELWEDAIRVAKNHGGANASKQVAYAWAVSLGGEGGAVLLKKFGLLEQAVDYAMESGAFTHAFELTRVGLKSKLPDVHLKYAMFLEDEGRFADAEAEFIKADKPKEAIDMYVHQQDWIGAMRVAENYDPSSVLDVQLAQAKACVERKEWSKAEAMFLKAKRPEAAIRMYQDCRMWEQALRVAADYLPSKVQEIHIEIQAQMGGGTGNSASGGNGGGGGGGHECVVRARQLEQEGNYAGAVDALLELTTAATSDLDALEAAWESAVKLAMTHVPGRVRAVVAEAGRRLTAIGRERQANELYESAGMPPPGAATPAPAPAAAAAGTGSAARGAAPSAASVEEAARRGDWAAVHDMAATMGPDVAAQYAVKHATIEHRAGNAEV
jgi:intraflagellar transport protein 172